MIADFAQVVRQRIEQRIRSHEEKLGSGSAADYPAYRQACGRIQEAKAILHEVLAEELKKYVQDDD